MRERDDEWNLMILLLIVALVIVALNLFRYA